MATINIGTEREGNNHWTYDVTVQDEGQSYQFNVTLNWSDYDLWCHGRVAPERVVRAAMAFLLSREPVAEILSRFDCGVIRRYFPDVDQELPQFI